VNSRQFRRRTICADPELSGAAHDPELTASYFPGEGPMVRAVHEKDWSQTLLGPVSSWPESIRNTVGICLNSHFPMLVLCGPELIYIYNDAAIPIFGEKHPWALGRRVADVWPEAWATIGPMLDSVLATGSATKGEDLLLLLERRGFVEECYFTFSYSPIRIDGGTVCGIFVAVLETTARVIQERRLRILSDLATQIAHGRGQENVFDPIAEALSRNPRDMPFAALYLADCSSECAVLSFCTGLVDEAIPDPHVAIGTEDDHPVARVLQTSEAVLFDLDGMAGNPFPRISSPERPRQALAMPLSLPGHSRPRGVFVVGVNPLRPLDQDQHAFFDLVCGHIATAVAHLDAIEAERRRVVAMAESGYSTAQLFGNATQGNGNSEADLRRAEHALRITHAELERRVAMRMRELREASRLLFAVFDRAPGGIAITDIAGRFIRANAAYQNLVGYTEEELQNLTVRDLADPQDLPRKEALLRQLLNSERESFEMEVRYRRRDGSVLWINNFVSTITDEQHRPSYFVKMAQDITDRKRAEREILASQSELRMLYDRLQTVREEEKRALAREVHDQLGQILSAAKIDIKLLEDEIRPQDAALSRRKISTELRSARRTLEKAIQLVRQIATELRAPELEEQGLYAAIAWHASDFERRTKVVCNVSMPENVREPTGAIATALFRIFQEAMTNVLRHAKARHVWVSLELRGDMVLLRVRDDGRGIPRKQIRSARSLGLMGMRERAAIAKGRLVVGPLRPSGTLVAARIPMTGAPEGIGALQSEGEGA
jgi:PAS domain S-box-containing protein